MRRIILGLAVSLDGYIEGPNGEYDWCLTDQEVRRIKNEPGKDIWLFGGAGAGTPYVCHKGGAPLISSGYVCNWLIPR